MAALTCALGLLAAVIPASSTLVERGLCFAVLIVERPLTGVHETI